MVVTTDSLDSNVCRAKIRPHKWKHIDGNEEFSVSRIICPDEFDFKENLCIQYRFKFLVVPCREFISCVDVHTSFSKNLVTI